MAEWLKAHAWKACIPQAIQGSNPCLSASLLAKPLCNHYKHHAMNVLHGTVNVPFVPFVPCISVWNGDFWYNGHFLVQRFFRPILMGSCPVRRDLTCPYQLPVAPGEM